MRTWAAVGAAALSLGAGRGAAGQELGGCPMLPEDDIWNTRVDTLPRHPRSDLWVESIGAGTGLHADFGAGLWQGGPIGIPYDLVGGDQAEVPVHFYYFSESDRGPWPVPPDASIEGGDRSRGDRHVLVVDTDACVLYEMWKAYPTPGGGWVAGSGAVFDLSSSALRPDGWTSADAAGLPVLPGLVRWDEVEAGEIRHALRFTISESQKAHLWPARHDAASSTDPNLPPMGARFRLRADYPMAGFSPEVQVILQALKTYGMMVADNGSDWYISGVPDERWDNDDLQALGEVRGADFEAVDVSGLMIDEDSGQARAP